MKYTIKIKQLEDGYLEVRLKGYGKTLAKNIEDVGTAISELIQATHHREDSLKELLITNEKQNTENRTEKNYIEVAEKLYRHLNSSSKMCTPNSAITTEKWYKEWLQTKTNLSAFDWCIKNKTNEKIYGFNN